MKKSILSIAFALVFSLVAFATEPIDGEKKEVKTETSKVTWKAYKVAGSHFGSIALQSGALMFDENKLTGGEFTVDMTTINTEDLEGEYKGKLDGHLNSADFFDTANHTTSSLVFTAVNATGKNSYFKIY
jgi:polyisoprenoid-binding protein YceI